MIAGLRSREDVTILVTTHYLDEAQRLADRVAIVHHGEIVALDRPEALLVGLGNEILEFRVDGDAEATVQVLRSRGVAGPDAFSVGARVTVPLHGRVRRRGTPGHRWRALADIGDPGTHADA